MAYRRTPFAPNEWYHCFSRGIEGCTVFETQQDFRRFEELLYLANDIKPFDRATIRSLSHAEILRLPRSKNIVEVGAYCLMNTHPHLLLQEKEEGGISKFMHKIGTGYTGYFNAKHQRIGNLLVKPFTDDRYLRRVTQYIHLNPSELFEPRWKDGAVSNIKKLQENLLAYPYSSLSDYFGAVRPERAILGDQAMELLGSDLPSLDEILEDTKEYYAEIEGEFWRRQSEASPPTTSRSLPKDNRR